MKNEKKFFGFCLSLAFIFISMNQALAGNTPFSGLMTYLAKQYSTPFQVAGTVKEVSEGRLIFSLGKIPLEKGQELWVNEHKKGISPALQALVARIRVETLFSSTALARVVQVIGRPIEKDDYVVTPAPPLILFYTNIAAKHTFVPYQRLLKALMGGGFEVQEITGDSFVKKPGANNLLLRLEWEADHLVCQLTEVAGGPLLYSESVASQVNVPTVYPAGHEVQGTAEPGPVRGLLGPSVPRETADYYRLSGRYSRVVKCDLEGDSIPELALLGPEGAVIYRFGTQHLTEKLRYNFGKGQYYPLHLHAMDLDGDGGDELLLSLARPVNTLDKEDNELCSEILTLKHGKLEAIQKNFPYYLRVIRDRAGKAEVLAQREGDYTQYNGPIYSVSWDKKKKKAEIGDVYKPAQGIDSIYQFNLVPDDPERVMILEPGNDLHGYFAPAEKVEARGERNYGRYRETVYPLKLEKVQYLGGFDDKKTSREVYSARRFELVPALDEQSFLIYKERDEGIIASALQKIYRPTQGTDQVVSVKWEGERIIETWESKKMGKDVLDFTFLDDPARVLVLFRDDDGYGLESLR